MAELESTPNSTQTLPNNSLVWTDSEGTVCFLFACVVYRKIPINHLPSQVWISGYSAYNSAQTFHIERSAVYVMLCVQRHLPPATLAVKGTVGTSSRQKLRQSWLADTAYNNLIRKTWIKSRYILSLFSKLGSHVLRRKGCIFFGGTP